MDSELATAVEDWLAADDAEAARVAADFEAQRKADDVWALVSVALPVERPSMFGIYPCRNAACPYETNEAGTLCAACCAEKFGEER